MSENSSEVLDRIIQRLAELSLELLNVLQSERRALIDRALPKLEAITVEKGTLCRAIDAAAAELGPLPLRHQIAELAQPHRARLAAAHERLLELAGDVQKSNAVNGKIVHRSQQSVRELMRLMSGTETDALYSAQGYQAQRPSLAGAPGTAIARA